MRVILKDIIFIGWLENMYEMIRKVIGVKEIRRWRRGWNWRGGLMIFVLG